MAYYAGEGGSRTAGSTPSSRSTPSARSGGVPVTRYDDIDSLIAEAQNGLTGAFPDQAKLALLNNLTYIKNSKPLTIAEKESQEIDWSDIGKLMLDIVGYGAAIGSIIPYPQTRVGGRIISATSRAARAALFGPSTRGIYGGLSPALRELDNATRQYQRYLQRNKKRIVRK